MKVTELAILIISIGFTLGGIGISIQVMRFLAAVTDNVKDLRKTVKNVGVIVEEFADEQKILREILETGVKILDDIKETVTVFKKNVINPMTSVGNLLKKLSNAVNVISNKFGLS